MLRLERSESPLDEDFAPRNVFQTPEWLQFVARTQGAEPVVARVYPTTGPAWGASPASRCVAFGVPILGSPFKGWMTGPMGFDLDPAVPRRDALEALMTFAFKEVGCLHVEVLDRHAAFTELDGMRPAGRAPHLRARPGTGRGLAAGGPRQLVSAQPAQERARGRHCRGGARRRVRRRVLRAAGRRVREAGHQPPVRPRAGAPADPLPRTDRQPADAARARPGGHSDRDRHLPRPRRLRLPVGGRQLAQPP